MSSLLAVTAALAVGVTLAPGRRLFPVVAAVGLCDVGANVLVGLALTEGYLSVVSVLASLYPVVTVALASILLRERIARPQLVGVAGALTGAALITAG
jgi:drug/metabolite transporter (DMT)-like permease